MYAKELRTVYWCLVLLAFVLSCSANTKSDLSFADVRSKSVKGSQTAVKTFENDTVLLQCPQNTPQRNVRWHKDDVLLIDSRYLETVAAERLNLWPNGTLQVSNVQIEDAGEYYCESRTSTDEDVQTVSLEVQYAPVVLLEPSGIVELPIGALFEVICEAKGVPQPAIAWRLNGKIVDDYQISNRKNRLIKVKHRHMSGPIECLATNGVASQPSVAGVYLNVLFPPEVRSTHNVVYTKIGARVHLECIVEAAPPAEVYWFHHGIPVSYDSRTTRHDNELQSNRSATHYYTKMKHTLIIKSVRDFDLGFYECRAENTIDSKSVYIDLTGRPMPCIFKINPGLQSSTSHNIVWQAESLSPILEFKLKFRQVPSSTSTTPQNFKTEWTELTIPSDISAGPIYTTSFELRGLQPASVFEVTVLARNHFGWSDNSKIVRFTTGGEVEFPNYSSESNEIRLDNEATSNDKTPELHAFAAVASGSDPCYCRSFTHTLSCIRSYFIWVYFLTTIIFITINF